MTGVFPREVQVTFRKGQQGAGSCLWIKTKVFPVGTCQPGCVSMWERCFYKLRLLCISQACLAADQLLLCPERQAGQSLRHKTRLIQALGWGHRFWELWAPKNALLGAAGCAGLSEQTLVQWAGRAPVSAPGSWVSPARCQEVRRVFLGFVVPGSQKGFLRICGWSGSLFWCCPAHSSSFPACL